jgi:S1-C subfamily serine protease
VRVKEVTAGSLAEKSGLRAGDRVVAVAGAPARSVGQVIAAVRRQPEGTMLPMKLLRGEETLELVVRFPAKP